MRLVGAMALAFGFAFIAQSFGSDPNPASSPTSHAASSAAAPGANVVVYFYRSTSIIYRMTTVIWNVSSAPDKGEPLFDSSTLYPNATMHSGGTVSALVQLRFRVSNAQVKGTFECRSGGCSTVPHQIILETPCFPGSQDDVPCLKVAVPPDEMIAVALYDPNFPPGNAALGNPEGLEILYETARYSAGTALTA
jgi:hypothetical protein